MDKSYTVAGVSKLDGVYKFRVANGKDRVKTLAKNGHTDIDLVDLPYPMTKKDAVSYLLQIDFDDGVAVVRAALVSEAERYTEKPKGKPGRPRKAVAEVPAEVAAAEPAVELAAAV